MKLNIEEESNKEINLILEKFKTANWDQIDETALERKIKFSGEKRKVFIVMYPELLFYNDKTCPWVCIRLEDELIKENEEYTRELCKFFLQELDKVGLSPFKDEDAFCGHFRKEDYELKCYVNLDYPEGYWENHVL